MHMNDIVALNKHSCKILILDVDGTLTDGKLYIGNNGEVCKAFNVKDGCGIKDILPKCGIKTAVMTARDSRIVELRCRELDISMLFQNVRDKAKCITELAQRMGFIPNALGEYEELIYMGDDLPDIEAMKLCAFRAAPSDASHEVTSIANWVSTKKGGDGAVRELIDIICANWKCNESIIK